MVLNCEMCGASLNVNKAINDVVICEYCDSATNIHGIVRLNMSSDDRAAALMKRGFVLIEFKVWDKAKYVLSRAVEYDSKNARAYLGLLMVDTKVSKEEQLASYRGVLSDYVSYQKALEFADVELKSRLVAYNDKALERKRERERIQQEREAREQQRIEEEKEAARKFRKRVLMITIPTVLIIAALVFGSLRSRSLSLANLRNFTDLNSAVEMVGQGIDIHEINERGMTPSSGSGTTYNVNHNLIRAAGFSEISIRPQGFTLREVTQFAGIDLDIISQVRPLLREKYGIEAEVSEYGGEERFGQGTGALRLINATRTPSRVYISFEKEGVPVVIRRFTEYSINLSPREPGTGMSIMPDIWNREVSWTVIVGSYN